jgi:hypothetical protein
MRVAEPNTFTPAFRQSSTGLSLRAFSELDPLSEYLRGADLQGEIDQHPCAARYRLYRTGKGAQPDEQTELRRDRPMLKNKT